MDEIKPRSGNLSWDEYFMCIASLYGGFVTVNVDNAAHIGGLLVGFLLLIITNIIHEKYT